MKILIYLSLALVFVLITTIVAFSQTPPPMPFMPDQAPIDGGLSILAAAGGAYAVKKIRDRKKLQEPEI